MFRFFLIITFLITQMHVFASNDINFCIVKSRWANVHKQPDSKSELVTQVIYGDPLYIEKQAGEWTQIRVIYQKGKKDSSSGVWTAYSGWIKKSNIVTPINRSLKEYTSGKRIILVNKSAGLYVPIYEEKGNSPRFLDITPEGTILPSLGTKDRLTRVLLPTGKTGLVNSADIRPFNAKITTAVFLKRMIFHAKKYMKKPYLWGGTSPGTVDCSGLMYLAARTAGRLLPRDSDPQQQFLTKISRRNASRGDLIFFSSNNKTATHVGIYLGNNRVLHASGKNVHVAKISGSLQRNFWGFAGWKRYKTPIKKYNHTTRKIKNWVYGVHFGSMLGRSNAVKKIRWLKRYRVPVFIKPIATRRGLFNAVYSGFFTYYKDALRYKRSKHRFRTWRRAAIRKIRLPFSMGRRFHFYSVQLMSLLNPSFAVSKMRRLYKKGYPVWIKYDGNQRGRIWYTIMSGYFSTRRSAKKYSKRMRRLLGVRSYVRRIP